MIAPDDLPEHSVRRCPSIPSENPPNASTIADAAEEIEQRGETDTGDPVYYVSVTVPRRNYRQFLRTVREDYPGLIDELEARSTATIAEISGTVATTEGAFRLADLFFSIQGRCRVCGEVRCTRGSLYGDDGELRHKYDGMASVPESVSQSTALESMERRPVNSIDIEVA